MGLDAVEILMAWESAFNIQIEDREAEQIRTPRMAIDLICRKLNVDSTASGPCLSARAFYKLRQSLTHVSCGPRQALRPGTKVRGCLPALHEIKRWNQLAGHLGHSKLDTWNQGTGWMMGNRNLGDIALDLLSQHPSYFRNPGEPWTRTQVRQIVRSIVADTIGSNKFSDDDDFIHDLRLD